MAIVRTGRSVPEAWAVSIRMPDSLSAHSIRILTDSRASFAGTY
jgi:hypothetical protein